MQRNRILSALAGAALLFTAAPVRAQTIDSASIAGMRWRELGPADFEGRMSDVVGIPSPSKTLFVAAAGGGIWKTMNNGVTWRPVFDDKRVISMGMLAIAPSDTMQVWAGTGEPNSRNTIEAGAGIYKSIDGGITWKFMGLEKTQHIGRIVVNPRDPNTVYVAALGAAWKSSPERGLYKTTDGGATWKLVKFISDKAGFVDVALDPRDPNHIYAAAWERLRTPYSLKSGGPGSGLWESKDAGATWTEIKGGGFPEGAKGRIGLAISLSDPNYIYAEVEAAAPSKDGSYVPARVPAGTGLYRSTDAGKTWTRTNTQDTRPFYYSQVRVDPKNRDRVYFSSTQIQVSDDGGKTARPAAQQVHVDDHGMWIDPNDPERFVIANDGGLSITFDRGGNFIQTTNLPIGQFYEITYDYSVPYNVCSGAQDNGAWCGPSRRKQGGTPNAYWYTISGGDGFYTAMDPTDPNIVYGESQGGNASRLNLKTGERMNFAKPSWQALYKQWEDSMAIVRGDPLKPETKEMAKTLAGLRAQQKQDSVDLNLRFNWNSPFFISPHNPDVIYFAGNRVLKSMKRGEDFQLISPDLSKKEWAKIDTSLVWTGGITIDATQAETFGTVVALMESYVKPGLLYAGTDDGNVWKTVNDGATWENLTTHFPGLPPNSWVSRVEPSHFDTLTAYVTFEDHRVNDFTPYVYVTNDGGKSFRSIANNLPNDGAADFVHVIREDPFNRDVLYVGTSLSVYASIDRGAHWTKFASNLPSVAVYDLKIHPRDHELMAATHGRSLWAVDVVPIEQMTAKTLAASATLFEPKTAMQYGEGPTLSSTGNGNAQMFFSVPSPPYGAEISYRLGTAAGNNVRLNVSDARGDTIATLNGPGSAGTHTVVWNYQGARRVAPVVEMLSPSERRDSILKASRAPMVLDSLTKAKFDSAAIARVRQLLAGGGAPAFGGRGGGGGGGRGAASCDHPMTMWEPFCARPGEGEAGGGGGGGGGRGGNPESANVLKIYSLIGMQPPVAAGRGGGGGRGAAGGGRGALVAGAGDYLVTLSVGGQSYKQVLHVEHVSGSEEGGFQFGGATDKQP